MTCCVVVYPPIYSSRIQRAQKLVGQFAPCRDTSSLVPRTIAELRKTCDCNKCLRIRQTSRHSYLPRKFYLGSVSDERPTSKATSRICSTTTSSVDESSNAVKPPVRQRAPRRFFAYSVDGERTKIDGPHHSPSKSRSHTYKNHTTVLGVNHEINAEATDIMYRKNKFARVTYSASHA